jgi:hypothetical protein
MSDGIPQVSGDGIPSIFRLNALELFCYFIKSFVPPDALPALISAADRIFEPVFIIVNILQGDRLRADVTPAKRVVFITANTQALIGFDSNFDAAYRLAEVTAPIMNAAIVGGFHSKALTNFQSLGVTYLEKQLDSLTSQA